MTMTYGIPEPGSYFRVPEDDYADFECAVCGEWFEAGEMNDCDDRLMCGWCAEEWEDNR